MVGVTNSSAFQVLEDKSKRMVLKELKDKGASYRQLERLTGVGRGLIQKLWCHWPVPVARWFHEKFLNLQRIISKTEEVWSSNIKEKEPKKSLSLGSNRLLPRKKNGWRLIIWKSWKWLKPKNMKELDVSWLLLNSVLQLKNYRNLKNGGTGTCFSNNRSHQ